MKVNSIYSHMALQLFDFRQRQLAGRPPLLQLLARNGNNPLAIIARLHHLIGATVRLGRDLLRRFGLIVDLFGRRGDLRLLRLLGLLGLDLRLGLDQRLLFLVLKVGPAQRLDLEVVLGQLVLEVVQRVLLAQQRQELLVVVEGALALDVQNVDVLVGHDEQHDLVEVGLDIEVAILPLVDALDGRGQDAAAERANCEQC